MVETTDIKERIELDYGDQATEVVGIFNSAIAHADHLNNNRIIRCILFLAEKSIEKLKANIKAATIDPRDVMLWAEYRHHDDPYKIKRIRDFSRAFDEAEEIGGIE